MSFTNKEKLDCIEREIAMRQRIYPRRIGQRGMTQVKAEREIALMREIAADYWTLVEKEKLP